MFISDPASERLKTILQFETGIAKLHLTDRHVSNQQGKFLLGQIIGKANKEDAVRKYFCFYDQADVANNIDTLLFKKGNDIIILNIIKNKESTAAQMFFNEEPNYLRLAHEGIR